RRQEVVGRDFFVVLVEHSDEGFVVLFAFASQVNDWLEQQSETVFIQCPQDRLNRVGLIQAFIGGRVVYDNPVASFMARLLFNFSRGGVCPPKQLFGFRRVLGNGGNPDGDGQGNGAAVDVKQVVLHSLADFLAELFHGLIVARKAHQAERIIAEAGQGHLFTGIFLQKRSKIAEEQICSGDAHLAFHGQEIIEGNVRQGAAFVV